MDKQTGPKGFLVVLPGEIIEIPQDSDKSWLTLFYSLPRELAEKWKPAYELPRCPYEVLRTDKYDHIVCGDMFKLLVWDCYAWCAWQLFQVKDRKGSYRDIPGNWNQYAGYFPLWRLSYSIIAEHYRERPGDIEAAHGRLDRTGDCRQGRLQDRQRSP